MDDIKKFKVIEKVFPSQEPENYIPAETRWIIVDKDNNLLDNANGYGYKTKRNAYKAGWYKFQGGRGKINKIESWWKGNKAFSKRLNNLCEYWCKEIARGEVDFDKEAIRIAEEMKIQGFDVKFLRYIP